jgi:hypothetical protein
VPSGSSPETAITRSRDALRWRAAPGRSPRWGAGVYRVQRHDRSASRGKSRAIARLSEPLRKYATGWLATRRHGLPARMVAEATEHRLAGDWRGACAAAGMDVAVDLARVGDRYGAEIADALADALRHLVPDLVRWHLPRQPGGIGLLVPGLTVPLARYRDPVDGTDLALSVGTPEHRASPQRLTLRFGPPPVGDGDVAWDADRYLWDDRATGGLLRHLGGGHRAPFHHRDGRRLRRDELPTAAPRPSSSPGVP